MNTSTSQKIFVKQVFSKCRKLEYYILKKMIALRLNLTKKTTLKAKKTLPSD